MFRLFFLGVTVFVIYPLGGPIHAQTNSHSPGFLQGSAEQENETQGGIATLPWQSKARLDHFVGSTRGLLIVDQRGIEFRPEKESAQRWSFSDIRTLDLAAQRLELTSYENRGWHRAGDRVYRFDLDQGLTPGIAAAIADHLSKPLRNRLPQAEAVASTVIAARHTTRTGGSNGVLRFTGNGLGYLTESPGDSRAWRWADLRTVSSPDAYHLVVFGFLDTFSFELKQPISRALQDRLWDKVYGRGLSGVNLKGGDNQ